MGVLLKLTIIGVVLAALGDRLVQFSHRSNFFREIEQVDLPNCQLLKGIEYGSEDIEVLPNGLAFISSGLKYPGLVHFAPEKPGEIFLLDLNEERLRPFSLRISKGFDLQTFNPHGMSTYIDEKDDTVYLFVVNHPLYKSTVEIFKFEDEENVLVHLKTIKHPSLYNVNDVVAVGPESFYATNDHYFTDFIMRFVEMFIGLTWTNVVYYSPGDVRQVASGFYSANGIAMSSDKKFIYVADVTGHTISIFEKHANWSLSPVKVVQLETLLDNLSVDPLTGDVWAGAHPNGYKLVNYNTKDAPGSEVVDVHFLLDNLSVDPVTGDIWTGGHPNASKFSASNPDDLPGSEVIRVRNIHSDNPIITRVYANNGSVLQASSCASVYKGQLLVGTVIHRALHCPLE